MECKCSVPGRIIHVTQLEDAQHRSILLHLSKLSCLEQKATKVFLPNTSLQYLKAHGAEDGHLSQVLGNLKVFAFCLGVKYVFKCGHEICVKKWDSRNSSISVVLAPLGTCLPCLQTRRCNVRLSSKLNKIEFVLPQGLVCSCCQACIWLLATVWCPQQLPSLCLRPHIQSGCRYCATELVHVNL